MKLVAIVAGVMLAIAVLTALYLLVRSFHHQWKWQNKVNENSLRRAVLEEADVQFEVAPDGFIRPIKRSERGHTIH
jgi:hypothetical protein